MKLLDYCKANRLFAAALFFVLGTGAWLLAIIVPGPSSQTVMNCALLPALMAVLICAIADYDKVLPAAPARFMLANNVALALIALFLNGDGAWHEVVLFVVAVVVTLGCVILHAGWKERHEEKPPEEPSAENDEECQLVEHHLTK